MPKISIIIPVYNAERYIRQCLNSVLTQTLTDIEIIVINDGSTGNSLKILEEYVAKYPGKIRLINSVNQGPGPARNLGINIANGEYIWFIDSDDWIYNDSARKMYSLAKEYNVSMVTCGLQRRFGNIKKPSKNSGVSELIDLDEKPNSLLYEKPCIGNKLIKQSLIGELRMPNTKWEDLPFTLTLVADSERYFRLSQREYNYRMNLDNTTTKDMMFPYKRIIESLDVLSILFQNFKDRDIYEEYSKQLKEIYIARVLRRVADVVTWINFSHESKRIIINKLVNAIEIKYPDIKVDDLYECVLSFNPVSLYFLKKRGLTLLDKNLRKESDEEQIKESIVKLLK